MPPENIELSKEILKYQNGGREIAITKVYDSVLWERSKTGFSFMTLTIFLWCAT